MVNYYRYEVKVNGKWKVRSIYIPVGKLPKVREAIILSGRQVAYNADRIRLIALMPC